jgi:hypothetical protein
MEENVTSAGISLWATAAIKRLLSSDNESLCRHSANGFDFEVKVEGDSLWVITSFGNEQYVAFRAAYSPDGYKGIEVAANSDETFAASLSAAIGKYKVTISWPKQQQTVLHYTATLQPERNMFVPFWPKDIVAYGKQEPAGEIHISQIGGRSGLLYASFKEKTTGSFLYLQNLTALGSYNIDTETSAAGIVGGQWPEMGLSLPPAIKKPLQKGKTYTISDAFIALSDHTPSDQFEISKGFLEALGTLYLLLPRPETVYQNYLDALPKALHDVQTNKGCWSHRSGHPYLNAYLCDYQTPPEIMVQLAVLLPIREYMRWSGETCVMDQEIMDGLKEFYNEQLGTVMRWLPAEEKRLDSSEEQKKPLVMDAWYLHHPLLNLTRLAIAGDEMAKELLLKSVDYAIKVAHHFNYCWPVFYKMDTLEVVKAETKPGKGGEKDVAGLYAHVMLQVWELTKDQKYFKEAEKAAQSMTQHGFDVLYQSNNTVFASKAMILLYRETKKELYRDLAYLFLANVFKNVALWECTYGYGKNFPSFFELFPLSDAPYTAVYEEQESYAGMQEFLNYALGVELLPSVRLLVAEFIRYAIHRMIYYYPPMLPQDMMVKEVKTGELDPKLWVALEDIHDGWEQSGSVGQEVYGAGLAFGIVPRQFIRIPDREFMVYVDYPILNQKIRGNTLHVDISGDSRLNCRLRIVTKGKAPLPQIHISTGKDSGKQEIDPILKEKQMQEYQIAGNQSVTVTWE